MEIRKVFVENLRRLMILNGKSQMDVSTDLGFKQNTFSDWMNGKTYPRAEAIEKLATYFNVNISDLVGENKGGIASGVLRINIYSKITSRESMENYSNVVGFLEVPKQMSKNGELVALKIKGESMAPMLGDGDVVIVQLQTSLSNNDIGVLCVNGSDAIVRKVLMNDYGMTLVCVNPSCDPVFFSHRDIKVAGVEIIGKVIESRRKF